VNGLPDFLILGAPKAGTTALYHALKQHPDVFMPEQKELRFFAFEGQKVDPKDPVNRRAVTDLDTYRAHFAGAAASQVSGEASPGYLSSVEAPARIKRTVPDVRMVAILRNPVERAYSHFLFAVAQGYEPGGIRFLEALRQPYVDYRGFRRERPYVSAGLYGEALSRYLSLFDREQIKLIEYEQLRSAPEAAIGEVLEFLGLDGEIRPSVGGDYAASGIPVSARRHALLRSRWVSRSLRLVLGRAKGEEVRAGLVRRNLHRPALSREEWTRAYGFFEDDIPAVEKLTGWDCGDWKAYPEKG
jgi:hypothetical protein